jgi:hypothetical protein
MGYGEAPGQAPRILNIHAPLGTVVSGGLKHGLVAAYLARHFTGVAGRGLNEPVPTVTTIDHHSLVTAQLGPVDRSEQVRAFLIAYYGNERDGQSLHDQSTRHAGRHSARTDRGSMNIIAAHYREQRNINPHREARLAMLVWHNEYAAQRGGSMDFYDSLTDSQKSLLKKWCDELEQERKRA